MVNYHDHCPRCGGADVIEELVYSPDGDVTSGGGGYVYIDMSCAACGAEWKLSALASIEYSHVELLEVKPERE